LKKQNPSSKTRFSYISFFLFKITKK